MLAFAPLFPGCYTAAVPEIAPFRGIRYDPGAVGNLARVVAPPYDVIAEPERDALEAASPYNVVRLILGREEPHDDERSNKYMRARALLEAWLAAGVLARDDEEALYVYEQRYVLGGERRAQRGILAAVRLDEPGGDPSNGPGSGGVLPHERTYDEVVEDRLNLLRATAVNLDCTFCVYDGGDAPDAPAAHETLERTVAGEPLARFATTDGIEHLVWRMTGADAIEAVARALEKTTMVIADGHHRWRTALRYRNERREAEGPGPWDAQLMFLVDAAHDGPVLLPIHRVVDGIPAEDALARLAGSFSVEPADTADPEALAAGLARRRAGGRTFAMHDGARAWWLTVADPEAARDALPPERSEAWRDLDVSVLHALVFDRLLGGVRPGFAHSAREAIAEIEAGRASLAFLLAPMPFESVRAVAEAGEAMPQKSTYFIPKPKTGIVLRPLD